MEISWEYRKSIMHEGSTEVPDEVIAKGVDAVQAFLKKHAEDEAIDYGESESEFRFKMPAKSGAESS